MCLSTVVRKITAVFCVRPAPPRPADRRLAPPADVADHPSSGASNVQHPAQVQLEALLRRHGRDAWSELLYQRTAQSRR